MISSIRSVSARAVALFVTVSFLCLVILVGERATASAQTGGALDPLFQPRVENVGQVRAVIIQTDGKTIVGGSFTRFNNQERAALVRLNQDGSLDAGFNPVLAFGSGLTASISAIVLQPDGKIFITGDFTVVNGVARSKIARLNADGSVDAAFDPGTGVPIGESVAAIVLQPDGKIILGGSFFRINNTNNSFRLARLNADGSVDAGFTPASLPNRASALALQTDGKLIVGISDGFSGDQNNVVLRLNSNGSRDTTFNTGSAEIIGQPSIYALKVQPDGKILAGGRFATYGGFGRLGLVRLNVSGGVDSTFNAFIGDLSNPSPFETINTISLQTDGKVIIGGFFMDINGALRTSNARLNSNGRLDTSFNAIVTSDVAASAVFPDGRVLLGGAFALDNFKRNGVVVVNADGSVDTSFNPGNGAATSANAVVRAVARQTNDKILVGGSFVLVNGARRSNLARLNADGTLDAAFNVAVSGNVSKVETITIQPDGGIVIGGNFTSVGNQPRSGIARLTADGVLDNSFNPVLNSTASFLAATIESIAVQSNGQIVIGGAFDSVDGTARTSLARLNGDGSLDAGFNPNLGSQAAVGAIRVQSNGKIVIGGKFVAVGGVERLRIARLNADGTLDAGFAATPGLNGFNLCVAAIEIQPDGRILVGGIINVINDDTRNRIVRYNNDGTLDTTFTVNMTGSVETIALQAGGKIIIGGGFTIINGSARRNLARLNADGSIDFGFGVASGANASVFAVTIQSDERVLIGGGFTVLNDNLRLGLAAVRTGANNTLFDYDGDGRADVSVYRPSSGTWYLQRSTAGFAAQQWGADGDIIAPADFDGDGRTDLAVFRPSNGFWYIFNLVNGNVTATQFGQAGDVPRPADFDGDGRADLAVFRPSSGIWYRLQSTNNQTTAQQFGQSGDAPQAADFDGDGKSDLAVFRSSNGVWYRLQSSNNQTVAAQFGQSGDVPVAADYDGDGRADLAVFRPANGTWYSTNSSNSTVTAQQFGQANDAASAADFDGDGKADLAVFRPSNGVWYQQLSASGFASTQFGQSGDRPTPNVFTQP